MRKYVKNAVFAGVAFASANLARYGYTTNQENISSKHNKHQGKKLNSSNKKSTDCDVTQSYELSTKHPNKYLVKKQLNAQKANEDLFKKGYTNPPYAPHTEVNIVKMKKKRNTFARVFEDKKCRKGGWLMDPDEPLKHSPAKLKEKYALAYTPKYYCWVDIKKGTSLRCGIVNKIDGWGRGGGFQYDTCGEFKGKFHQSRVL